MIILTVFTSNAQKKTKKALLTVLTEQAAREKTELNILLQNASEISQGNNCPPIEMISIIDSLYNKYPTDTNLQQQYEVTMNRLKHCNY